MSLRSAAVPVIGQRLLYRVPTPKKIMRWNRGLRTFITAIMSFIFGCTMTLLFCSHDETVVKNIRLEETGEDVMKASDEASLKETIHDFQPTAVKTTVAPKPTLPPYPPLVNGTPVIITPASCDENAFLIIIVVTVSRNFEARKAIRSSWAKRISEVYRRGGLNSSDDSFQVYFVVGSDEANNERVDNEAKRYNDILRGNFLDTYLQNELHAVKTLVGLKWATSVCNPKYVLKVTSESFVNVQQILQWLYHLKKKDKLSSGYKENFYTGFCHGDATGQARVIRNPQSRYFIPENVWPDAHLPAYVSGVGVVLSRDVAEKMVESSRQMSVIHIEDVFLGVLAKHLKINCTDEGSHFDIAYTTMLTQCEDLSFYVLGSVPAKDMFYLSQNVENLRDICEQENNT